MSRSRQSRFLTAGFFVCFAIWYTTVSYAGPNVYRFAVGEIGEWMLWSLTLLTAGALILLPFVRAEDHSAPRWGNAAICFGAVVFSDLLWRNRMFGASSDLTKILGLALDMATPVILGLGCVALVVAWRSVRPMSTNARARNDEAM